MGMMSLIGKLFGAVAGAPSDAAKLDGTSEAALTRSLSALPPDARGWLTFAEARNLFSTKDAQYVFGETDDDGRNRVVRGAAPGLPSLYAGRGPGLFRKVLTAFAILMAA
jgi:hypothetical protein